MTTLTHFTPGGAFQSDDEGRIPLAPFGASGHVNYLASTAGVGQILLTEIPDDERAMWEDVEVRDAILLGLQESDAGLAAPLDWDLDDEE